MNPRTRRIPLCLLFTLVSLISLAALNNSRSAARTDISRLKVDKNRQSSSVAADASHASESTDAARSAYGKLALQFEENRGQTDTRVRFLSRGPGYNLFLTETEAVIALHRANASDVLRLKLSGANARKTLLAQEQLAGHANYLIGNRCANWRTNVPTYKSIEYTNVYDGIDLVYHGNQQQLEYDFRLAAGANANSIRLHIEGAKSLRLDAEGNLLLETSGGELRQHRPIAYQNVNGERVDVACDYAIEAGAQVSFKLGAYDHSLPLIIDPVMTYASYVGGSGNDQATGIAVDSTGAAYVTGYTESYNFPLTPGALQGQQRGMRNAFVLKLNPQGNALVYATYLGGLREDSGNAITVDAGGNAYVAGRFTSPDFPYMSGFGTLGPGTVANGGVFVAKLAPNGAGLVYSTAVMGTRDDTPNALALGQSGNVYVVGNTQSFNFPLTPGVFQQALRKDDGFLFQLDQSGHNLVLSTFLGGADSDSLTGVAVDAQGAIYVAGQTRSVDFPTTTDALTRNSSGGSDATLTKFASDARTITYSTYLGGPGTDQANGIAVDAQGAIYLAGETDSPYFPTTPGVFQTTRAGATDAFLTKLNADGSMSASTLLGGNGADSARSIAVDASGFVYLCGETSSFNFPITQDAPQTALSGGTDAFVTRLGPSLAGPTFSTFTGGNLDERGAALALDGSNNIYVAGFTTSANFPVSNGALQTVNGGSSDAFIIKLAGASPGLNIIRGTVRAYTGMPLPGAIVNLSGPLMMTTTTDINGNFSFVSLPGGTYTVTPSIHNYLFSPQSASLSPVPDTPPIAFWGAPVYDISGRINNGSAPAANVNVTLSGKAYRQTTTDSNGYYYFRDLEQGGPYMVTPNSASMSFNPPNAYFSSLSQDATANFAVAYFIEGRVADAQGVGLDHATISLRGAQSSVTYTDSNGYFRFDSVLAGGSYTVEAIKIGYNFNPNVGSITSLSSNFFQNFVSFPQNYSITGILQDNAGRPLNAATVSLSGTQSATTTTAPDGRYTFPNLPRSGAFTVTPSLPYHTFAPVNGSVNALVADTIFNFTGTRQTYDITGHVTDNLGNPRSDVTLYLTGEQNMSATANTDASGNYSFRSLPAGFNYTITPSLAHYIFSPATLAVTALDSNRTGDFQAYPTHDISGHVADNAGNNLAGVLITLNAPPSPLGGPPPTMTGSTDANGNYAFMGLPAGGSYTVTPALGYYNFGPQSVSINSLDADKYADFTGTRQTYNISGHVSEVAGAPLAGVTITLSGGQTASVTTDAEGFYNLPNLPAGYAYTLTPSHPYALFYPESITISNLDSNRSVDIQGNRRRYIISGVVRDSFFGGGIYNAQVTLNGNGTTLQAMTGADGSYRFDGVTAGYSYTVTSSLNYYDMSPQSVPLNLFNADASVDFTATRQLAFIKGRIADANGNALPNVNVALSGARSINATTDAGGNYLFSDLPAGMSYTVTPSIYFYDFAPQSVTPELFSGTRTIDFTATRQQRQLSGHITDNAGNSLSGVTLSLSGGQANMSATTDAGGNYVFQNVPAGDQYTLTPSRAYYDFNPSSSLVFVGPVDRIFDFTGTHQSYPLNGRITDNAGNALPNVTVSLSGGRTATTTTSENGYYFFFQLPAGESYTVTPALADYSFAPASQTVNSLTQISNMDFAGTYLRHNISGHVQDNNGANLSNVTVSLTGPETGTTTTDTNGFYLFRNVRDGGPYLVTPALAYHNFNPAGLTIQTLNAPTLADFTGTRQTYDISGRITDSAGNPSNNVNVTLTGPETRSVLTDASGNYRFNALAAGYSYTLTPSLAYYDFGPQNSTVNPLNSNRSIDFTATRQTHDITGRVTDSQGNPLASITVNLLGGQESTTTTDTNGYYSLRGLAAGFNYSVQPFGGYYDYTPSASSAFPLTTDKTFDFTGTRQAYQISGRLLDNAGVPLSNANVNLSGARTAATTTNASGYYFFYTLPAGYSYTVTPQVAYYNVNPQSATINPLNLNRTADFTCTRQLYTINGRVADAQGVGLAGATVNLSGSQTGSTQTDAGGNYAFVNLPAGGNYTMTPVKAGYNFNPASASVNPLVQNLNANFTSARNLYQLAGCVADACGTGMSGVTVTLSGGQSLTTTTDASGNYVFNGVVSLNNYTVTPSKTGFTLTPANAQFTSLLSNQAGVNFTARASVTTLNPNADAYVLDSSTSTNFGTNVQLITRLKSGSNYQSYLKFDLSNFCGATKVLLRVYGHLSDTKVASVPLNVYAVSVTTWAENTINWTNKPADAGTVLQSVPVVGTTAKYYDLDITTYVKSELSAGRRIVSFALKNSTTTNTTQTILDSREATNKPQLVVTAP